MSDEELIALRQRNAERLEEAKKNLGTKWLLHPENKIPKKEDGKG